MDTAKDNLLLLIRKCHDVKTQEESRLFWKLWHWFDFWYFLNYAKPLHTLDFIILSIKHMNSFVCVGVLRAWLSVSICTKDKANSTWVMFFLLFVFFFWCWLIQWHFVFQKNEKKNTYVLHNMNEGYLHCGILHWELLHHKTVSFSKVLDSFWVLVCS